jgi:hypothetical protein
VRLPEGEDENEWVAVHSQSQVCSGVGEKGKPTVFPCLPAPLPVVDFFNHVNMLYGTIAEFCNKETVGPSPGAQLSLLRFILTFCLMRLLTVPHHVGRSSVRRACLASSELAQREDRRAAAADDPVIRLTCSFEFLFEDGTTYKKPTALPACEYVDALMNWVQSLLDDEEIFPSRIGASLLAHAARR